MSTQPEQLVETLRRHFPPEASMQSDAHRAAVEAATALFECREALLPFAAPKATHRDGDPEGAPEDDVMQVEVTAGDWMRACVVTGRMDVNYLRTLPAHVRPSEPFIASLAAQPPSEARTPPYSEVRTTACHAGMDGECIWAECPQLRDGEPARSGRHCPLDRPPSEASERLDEREIEPGLRYGN